jgi:hypothetical protein
MTAPRNDVESLVQQIDQELDRLEKLSRARPPESEFFAQITQSVSAVLSTDLVTIVQLSGSRFVSVANLQSTPWPLQMNGDLQKLLTQHLAQTDSKQNQHNKNANDTTAFELDFNGVQHQVISSRVGIGDSLWGAVLIAFSDEVDPLIARGCREFMSAVREIFEDYLVRVEPQENAESDRLLGLAKNVHSSLELEKVAHQVAAETRDLVDADRVWLSQFCGNRSRVVAISGVETHQRKAPTVVYLQRLIERIGSTGVSFWYDGSVDAVDETVRPALIEYLNESPKTASLAIVPLAKGPNEKFRFALAIEFLRPCEIPTVVRKINRLVPHADAALANSARFESIPFRFLAHLMPANWTGRGGFKFFVTIALLCLFGGLIVAGLIIPADLEIPIRGEIRPQIENRIFATHDGVIQSVEVKHGQDVSPGDTLVTLRSPDLDLELQRIAGELATTQQKREALQFAINQQTGTSDTDLRAQNQMAAEIKDLELRAKNLVKIYDLLEEQRDELEITSPIKGSVVTWEVRNLLQLRPIKSGDMLMTVSDLDGPWRLVLQVADSDVGHVLRAENESAGPLRLDYCVSSDAKTKFQATVTKIALETQGSADELPYVDIVGEFDGEHPRGHSGNTVVGRIHCGQQPVLFVWFRQVIEAVQRRFFW